MQVINGRCHSWNFYNKKDFTKESLITIHSTSKLDDFPTMILGELDTKQIQEINIQDGKFVKIPGRLKKVISI